MGNSSSTQNQEIYEPLVDENEAATEARARLEEAFFRPTLTKPASDEKVAHTVKEADVKAPQEDLPAQKHIAKIKYSSAVNPAEASFDPFCNLKQVDGWTVLVHPVSPRDTLAGLSLRYDVTTDAIRRANFMNDDRLISFTHLVIPKARITLDAKAKVLQVEKKNENLTDDPKHRERLVGLMSQLNSSNLGKCASEYYLSKNGFSLRSALQEAEGDTEWERKNRGIKSNAGWQ
jgi:LysM repeat protein